MSETLTIIGPSGSTAAVSSNALNVLMKSDFQKAVEDGDAYSWSSLTYDPDAHDTILAVENNSATRDLYIQEIHIQTDAAGQHVVFTASGDTMTGTAVTGTNLNRNSSNAAPATAKCDETNNAEQGATYPTRFYTGLLANDGSICYTVNGSIILPNDHHIAVDLTSAATAANVTIIGYFKDR